MTLHIIRAQNEKDLDLFFDLVEAYRLELNENACFPSYEKERLNYATDKTFIFLAKEGTQTCASIAFRPKTQTVYELKRLYVHPRYRRRKLADALLEHALPILRENGIRKIELETLKKLTAAQFFYQKHGFQPDENARHTDHDEIVPMGLTLEK